MLSIGEHHALATKPGVMLMNLREVVIGVVETHFVAVLPIDGIDQRNDARTVGHDRWTQMQAIIATFIASAKHSITQFAEFIFIHAMMMAVLMQNCQADFLTY